MQQSAINRMELINKLTIIPKERLSEVKTFIDFILSQSQTNKLKPINLSGIWKDIGFEKIKNSENELKKIRKEMDNLKLKP
ncbi:MAG: hypothetical protein U9P79_04370 [Candidatus Cloacimonadota bacterium]|nr:hypothetical protein [Candidatus Cloacimonadota bacterium]